MTEIQLGVIEAVKNTFDRALPAFIAAFTKSSMLTPQKTEKIRKMIDKAEER